MAKKKLAVAPVWRMRKDEIIKLGYWRCKHGHSGLEHYPCFKKENPNFEHVGIIDIESTGLKADMAAVICYCIQDLKSDDLISRVVTREELFDRSHEVDYWLLKDLMDDMRKFDRLIGFYSGDYRFDLPFLRTRAVMQDIDFPGFNSITFEDVYTTIKSKFCLTSSGLANSTRTLCGSTLKTNWFSKYWTRAVQGDQKALDYVVDHCQKDVQDLKKLYLKVYPYVRHGNRSI